MFLRTSTLSNRTGSRTPVSRAQSAIRRSPSSNDTVDASPKTRCSFVWSENAWTTSFRAGRNSISGSATSKARATALREVDDAVRRVGSDVEDLVRRAGNVDAAGDQGRDVVDVRERPRLQAVAEDRHRLTGHHLVHEDPDHVPVRVGEVLQLAVDVVRPEDRVVEAEHPLRSGKVELDGVLRDAVRILGLRDDILGHRRLSRAVDGDRAGEDEALDGLRAERGVEHVDRAEDVVRVVEAANEVREALRPRRPRGERRGRTRACETARRRARDR